MKMCRRLSGRRLRWLLNVLFGNVLASAQVLGEWVRGLQRVARQTPLTHQGEATQGVQNEQFVPCRPVWVGNVWDLLLIQHEVHWRRLRWTLG